MLRSILKGALVWGLLATMVVAGIFRAELLNPSALIHRPTSKPSDFYPRTVNCVYDIRDLIIDIPDFSDAPVFELYPRAVPSKRGGLFGPCVPRDPHEKTRAEMVKELMQRVEVAMSPWAPHAMRELGGQLIVTQSEAGQLAVWNELQTMRRNKAWGEVFAKGWPWILAAAICGGVLSGAKTGLRTRGRKNRGECAVCGYDLRYSPIYCPECGTKKASSSDLIEADAALAIADQIH